MYSQGKILLIISVINNWEQKSFLLYYNDNSIVTVV